MQQTVITVIALCVLLGVTALTYWWVSRKLQQLSEHCQQLELQIDYQAQQLQQTKLELEELRSGVIGVGQRVLQIESEQTETALSLQKLTDRQQALNEKQQALELVDPESKIYSRAMKMVKLGADLEEIMTECGLPLAEAELLFNLHQAKNH